jgi:hypothetical protein
MRVHVGMDFDAKQTNVTYSHANVAYSTDVWEEVRVSADRDTDGNIVGIEVVGFGRRGLYQALLFAQSQRLLFPVQFTPDL